MTAARGNGLVMARLCSDEQAVALLSDDRLQWQAIERHLRRLGPNHWLVTVTLRGGRP